MDGRGADMTFDVYYIKPKSGKHKFRKAHDSLINALRHAENLAAYTVDDYDGLFSYVKNSETGLVLKGDLSAGMWVRFEDVFPQAASS